MTKVYAALLGALLVSIAALVLFSKMEGPPKVEQMARRQRPGSSEFAVVNRTTAGGATAGFGYEVVLDTNGREASRIKRPVVWSAYIVEPFRVTWSDRNHLEIAVRKQDLDYAWSVKEFRRSGVTVRTEWFDAADSTLVPKPAP